MSFPIITKGNYHTQDGNIYINHGEFWYQNVNYLAAVPTQYNCTTYEQQFDRIIERIENNKLRSTATGNAFIMIGNELHKVKDKGAYRASEAGRI